MKPDHKLMNYIREMLNLGYDEDYIRKELTDKGWKSKTIDAMVKRLKTGHELLTSYDKSIFVIAFLTLIVLVFWVTGATSAPISTVLISFLPTILTVILSFAIVDRYGKRYLPFIVVIPLALCAMLYAASENIGNVEIENIILLNIIMSGLFILILNALRRTSVMR